MPPAAVRHLQDYGLALALAVVGVLEVTVPMSSVQGSGSRGWTILVTLVMCAALVVRRSHPLVTALVVLLGAPLAFSLVPVLVLFWGQFVPVVVTLFSVARHGTRRQALVGALAGVVLLLYLDFEVPVLDEPGEIVFHWTVSVLAWGLGWFVAGHERRATQQFARAELAETSSREQALQAVAEERARIARELHDIVAHSVSVMVVQAGAAEKAMDDQDYVRAALGTIRSTGTSALAEMRRVVALIRESDDRLDLQPQPDLADLERLVTDMDVPTTLHVEGVARPLTPGVALAAFRIVQEALTNVRRHARARSAVVTLRYGSDCLEIEVADDGIGADVAGGGNGLIGMRERVQMYGGSLETTTAPGRGFRVRAVLSTGALS